MRASSPVAYDEELADRIRELLGSEPGLTEQKMFGGLAFLIGGNMAIAASGQGGVLVHVDPEQSDELVATTSARLMEMRGRRMKGWLRVDAEDVRGIRPLAAREALEPRPTRLSRARRPRCDSDHHSGRTRREPGCSCLLLASPPEPSETASIHASARA